jgi:two-component system, NtrC family, nitrogen regulation response regulator NtrX
LRVAVALVKAGIVAISRQPDRSGRLDEVRDAAEREYILKKLEDTGGNIIRTRRKCRARTQQSVAKDEGAGIGPKE